MVDPCGFEKHLFISYAHIDNRPLTLEQQGWITRFHNALEAMLSMRIGRRAQIWRDPKLSGNDIFAAEIEGELSKAALLVCVLTPSYVESAWCNREVQAFCRAAEKCGGVVLNNKSRVLKVIKTPVDSEDPLPSVMKDMLGYEFYSLDDEAPIEWDPTYSAEHAQKYNVKLAKLAWDIAQLLKKLGGASPGEKAETPSSKPVVYLAECSYDQREPREALEAELRLHGYAILPESQLPREEAGYVAEVKRLLMQSKISIHLVGSNYGAVPDGPSQKSVVVLQNEAAIARSRNAGLKRVIWLPEGTASRHFEQQRFIEELHTDPETQFGADLITADLETLKGAVRAALERLEKPEPSKPVPASGARLVYLVCDEKDRKATIPLRRYLKSRNLEVEIPLFEGDAAKVRNYNEDLLARCDGAILFYGAAGESWKRTVHSDLRKMNGYREGTPLLASYTYLAEPATDDKTEMIELEEPNLINGLNGFFEAEMTPFLNALGKA